MKKSTLLFVLPGLIAAQSLFAQTGPHLMLSDQYPTAGEKITVTYNPTGTVVEGKKDITATVFYLDNENYPVDDINFTTDGKLLKGEITVAAVAKAFFIKINSGDVIDDNNTKGYVYLVYQNQKPIKGAFAAMASLYSKTAVNYYSKIKADNDEVMASYKKEFELYPESKKEFEARYYSALAINPDNKALIDQKIAELKTSTKEDDLNRAAGMLSAEGNKKAADSLKAVIGAKFPDGESAKIALTNSFFREKDVLKKDSIYAIYIKKYPTSATDKNSMDQNFKLQLAAAYLRKSDFDNYNKYAAAVNDKSQLDGVLNNMSWEWAQDGKNLDMAAKLSKQSVDDAAAKVASPVATAFTSLNQAKIQNQQNYDTYADTYAYILIKQNKPAEALTYMQGVYDRAPNDSYNSQHYAEILGANGKYDKALAVAEKCLRGGRTSDELKEELKKDYVKVKGSDAGYDAYLASVEKDFAVNARLELASTMINEPAPAFTLRDFYGKQVSLQDLKGKVVIVDFWATWCGPCKASFPGMQLAVDKYKDDPNVKFLFVDTWETAENYVDGAKKFIADNKYTFHVLLDEKGSDGRQSKVVSAFGVDGIPTKFVIDKNGNIRFKRVGFAGTAEELRDDVASLIELTSNPDGIVSTQAGGSK